MASIRNLKKDINHITYELLNECYSYKRYHPETKTKAIDEIIKNILKKRNELIYRIQHPNDTNKKALKEHYRQIIKDHHENFNSILNKLNDL